MISIEPLFSLQVGSSVMISVITGGATHLSQTKETDISSNTD